MRPEDRDAALIWDILNACYEVREFVKNCTYHEFENNKILRYAVERQIIVIGEASRKLSENFKAAHTDIPWPLIIAQRNIIAHEYGEILVERVWRVAKERIPELTDLIEPLLPEIPEN